MPYVLRPNKIYVKDPEGEGYLPGNVIAEETTEQMIADIEDAGEEQVAALEQLAEDIGDSWPQDYSDLTQDVTDLKGALTNAFIDLNSYTWELGSLQSGSGEELTSTTRVRSDYIPVKAGDNIVLSGNEQCLVVYRYSLSKAYVADSPWSNGNKYIVPAETAYVRILIRKSSSNDTMTNEDVPNQVARCSVYTILPKAAYEADEMKSAVDELNQGIGYVSTLDEDNANYVLRKNTGDSSLIEDATGTRVRVIFDLTGCSSVDVTAQSTYGAGIAVSEYSELSSAVKAGADYIKTLSYSYTTSEVVGKLTTGGYLTISLKKTNDSAITDEEKAAMVASLTVNLVCRETKNNIEKLDGRVTNLENVPQGFGDAVAASKNFNGTVSAQNNLKYLPAFLHISDIHGDAERFKRACGFVSMLGADALLSTGDMVYYNSTDDYSYIVNAASDLPFIPCLGNHDVWSLKTEQAMYEKYIEPFANDYTLPVGVTYPTYFHKDFADKHIRVISVNQFQADSSNSGQHYYVHYLQDQIDWLVDTLLSTPQGYGVILLMHTPEKTPVADPNYTKFKQTTLAYTYSVNSAPIFEIIDAFISGGTLTKTYTNGSGRTPETYSVDADFSTKNAGVEFIAYATGHLHSDNVSYVPSTTNKQLMLNITCANAWVNRKTNGEAGTTYPNYTELSDLARSETGPTQDAVNFYVIDRANKTVRIARLGANRTYDLSVLRDCMTIPYAD